MSEPPKDLRLWRLPRGRHGLPRELVERSQRERLLAAVVRVSAAKGYEATSVADVLAEAGVGRESFYELFSDKQDCMLAARQLLVEDLEATIAGAYTAPAPWLDRVRETLAATLGWFAADPIAGRVMLLELAALGPISRSIFLEDFERFSRLLEPGIDEIGGPPDVPGATGLAVGATFARIYDQIARDRAAQLPGMVPEMTYEVLVPFIGEARAREQERRARALEPSSA
ncbi:MAG TPA: TetR/AcrR family transcriptional regulator [Solirubrobacterales bacterium]|nr:TetR/AcrR family transcriptional regulator [Solirubrobacterales bacterium]